MTKTFKKGFTLAEVLTTLMVIGVVAAMTIPTLMNSTDGQQQKVAFKKAMSVLNQGTQLLTAQEEECFTQFNGATDYDAALAACMRNVMNGTLKGNAITTPDGMVFEFFTNGANNGTTLEAVCGPQPLNTSDGLKGLRSCGVIVDTNGLSKGTKEITDNFGSTGFSAEPTGSDQFSLVFTAGGATPTYFGASSKGYEYMFGTIDTNNPPYGNSKTCVLTTTTGTGATAKTTYTYKEVTKTAECSTLGTGWTDFTATN